jgi:hypothetical protein
MAKADLAATQPINGIAGQNLAIDAIMIWILAAGIPLRVLAVALPVVDKARQATHAACVGPGRFGLLPGLKFQPDHLGLYRSGSPLCRRIKRSVDRPRS